MTEWHIITCEYPPQPGGVSDYTRIVGRELAAAGDDVHVWCPPAIGETPQSAGVIVHRELGSIAPADLRRFGRQLDQFATPRCLLVQWVPHGYGYRSMNLYFCLWLWQRARIKGDIVELMVHEPYLEFNFKSWRQSGAAAVHRLMTIILLQAARRVWISIPSWEMYLRPYTLGRKLAMTWLPVPSNISVIDDPAGVNAVRAHYASKGQLLIGHFGTYGKSITDSLQPMLPELMQRHPQLVLLLLGRGGDQWRDELAHRYPALASRLHAPGALDAADISRYLSACDLMVQLYPGGISSRNGSAMACIIHGRPVVTTEGILSESLWHESGAVALAPMKDLGLLKRLCEGLIADEHARRRFGCAGKAAYERHFEVGRIVAEIRKHGRHDIG